MFFSILRERLTQLPITTSHLKNTEQLRCRTQIVLDITKHVSLWDKKCSAKRCLDVCPLQMLLINIQHSLLLEFLVEIYWVCVIIWRALTLPCISEVMPGGEDTISFNCCKSRRRWSIDSGLEDFRNTKEFQLLIALWRQTACWRYTQVV